MKYGRPILYTRGAYIVERNCSEAVALAARRTPIRFRLVADAHDSLRGRPGSVAATGSIPT